MPKVSVIRTGEKRRRTIHFARTDLRANVRFSPYGGLRRHGGRISPLPSVEMGPPRVRDDARMTTFEGGLMGVQEHRDIEHGSGPAPLPSGVTAGCQRPSEPDILGAREREVLLAWFRLDSKESAARALFVSVNTVKKHIERARAKYEAAGRPAHTQALLLIRAIQDGWLDIDEW